MTAILVQTDSFGVALVAEERQRQVDVEGRPPAHDAIHDLGELALAAVAYATPEGDREYRWLVETDAPEPHEHAGVVREPVHAFLWTSATPRQWPWGLQWWKPSPADRIRELTKAGALIAAEIDRLRSIEVDRTQAEVAGDLHEPAPGNQDRCRSCDRDWHTDRCSRWCEGDPAGWCSDCRSAA